MRCTVLDSPARIRARPRRRRRRAVGVSSAFVCAATRPGRRLPDQPLKVLILLDHRFHSYSPGAAIADIRLWLTRLGDWEKLAVVTDHDWLTTTVNDIAWMGSGKIRTFAPDAIDEARDWLVQTTH